MITTTVKLDSKIFDTNALRQSLSSAVYKSAKVFQSDTVNKMVESVPSGDIQKYYGDRNKGFGFSRSFRRSAKGQRPAVETGTLIRSVETTRNGEFVATVFIKHNTNPRNKRDAQRYAEALQVNLGRQIMTKADATEAQSQFALRIESEVEKLI